MNTPNELQDTVRCAVCERPVGDSTATYHDAPLCDDCAFRAEQYGDRVERRIERLKARAERKAEEAKQRIDTAHSMASDIPFGQPILVGHHSEKRDRNYRARIENNYRKGFEGMQEAERLEQRAEAAERNDTISSDDPLAVLKLQAKIDRAEASQERMKRINKLIRKHAKDGEAAQLAALKAEGMREDQALEILHPKWGRPGFASWALSNNNANIRRMKQRRDDLRQQIQRQYAADAQPKPDPEHTPELLPGLRVVEDVEDNRLRLYFDEKPSYEARAILKHSGWRWSPSVGAWQRYLNNASRFALTMTVDALKKLNEDSEDEEA